MYHVSRAIYRDLADAIDTTPAAGRPASGRCLVLAACETALAAVALGAPPQRQARRLARELRRFTRPSAHWRLEPVIERHFREAEQWISDEARHGRDALGEPLRCGGYTKAGTPCARPPVGAHGYCPSHVHLATGDELVAA